MESTSFGNRFFRSTRGQIVRLIRGTVRTVEDLAISLDLTDNAVRAHLATLERDGLVRQAGVRRDLRKPHFTYALTPAAENLFPKSYDALLNVLLGVLKEKLLTPRELREALREVGRKLARAKTIANPGDSGLPARTRRAVDLLESMGGAPKMQTDGDKLLIQSASCPLATAVESHSEVCSVAEALIAEVTGAHVREKCNKTEIPPRCSFEITEKAKSTR